ncbi:hypothetical protein DSTSK_41850 [Desulforhabdus sp. TSK]|nr:hypothetical protein DSTSK_41850 [Desulforhabdus sp. TSK]
MDHSGGHSDCYSKLRDVACDNRPGANHSARAYLDARKNDDPCSDPNVVSNDDTAMLRITLKSNWYGQVLEQMVSGHDDHIGAHQDVIADLHLPIDICIDSDIGTITKANSVTCAKPDASFH